MNSLLSDLGRYLDQVKGELQVKPASEFWIEATIHVKGRQVCKGSGSTYSIAVENAWTNLIRVLAEFTLGVYESEVEGPE